MHKHTQIHNTTHTHLFLWNVGTSHRCNAFYTVQTVCAIALHLNLDPPKKPHSVWFISVLKYGDMGKCPHKSPSPRNTRHTGVIIQIYVLMSHKMHTYMYNIYIYIYVCIYINDILNCEMFIHHVVVSSIYVELLLLSLKLFQYFIERIIRKIWEWKYGVEMSLTVTKKTL